MEVGEVSREAVHEQHFLAGLRMRAHDGMLGIGKSRLERVALFDRHGGAEASLDAVTRAQRRDLHLHMFGQIRIGADHVDPDRVATDLRRLHTTQHATHRRCVAPGRIAVIRVLVVLGGTLEILVDAYQARVLRIAPDHRMILELSEAPREGYVLGARHLLRAREQHFVLEQQGLDLAEQPGVARRRTEVDADQLGTDAAGQLFDSHRASSKG